MSFWRALRGLATFAPFAVAGFGYLSWGVAVAVCLLSATGILCEAYIERNYSMNPDHWEALILIDSATIVILLSAYNLAVSAGVLTLAPYITRRRRIEIGPRTAYVTSVLVLFAGWANGRGWIPSNPQIASAIGISVIAYLVSKSIISLPKFLQEPVPAAFAPTPSTSDEIYEALRERHHALRSSYKQLELESGASRAIVALNGWRNQEDRTSTALAKTLRELAGVQGLALFVIPDARDGFSLHSSAGSAPTETLTISASLQTSPIILRETAERALKTEGQTRNVRVSAIEFTDRGRLMGLIALFDEDRLVLEAGLIAMDKIGMTVGAIVRDEQETRRLREKLAQLDLLNRFATRQSEGTMAQTAGGICSDVASELGLDGCAVIDLTGIEPKTIAGVGDTVTELLQFARGSDLKGWMGSGAPEVVIDDAREDKRCDETLALRKGIGALMVQPLISSGTLTGALVSYSSKRRGISSVALSTLRALAPYILRQVFGGFSSSKPGLVDADTFWHGTQGPGSFVEVDLGRSNGPATPELQNARRRLITAAMGRLPQGGLITRRTAGTLLVFLPGYDEMASARWADGLRTFAEARWEMRVDGRGQSQQSRQFFERMSA